jgi:hypothetical protein
MVSSSVFERFHFLIPARAIPLQAADTGTAFASELNGFESADLIRRDAKILDPTRRGPQVLLPSHDIADAFARYF